MEKFKKREKIDRKKKEQESAEAISGLKIYTLKVALKCQSTIIQPLYMLGPPDTIVDFFFDISRKYIYF